MMRLLFHDVRGRMSITRTFIDGEQRWPVRRIVGLGGRRFVLALIQTNDPIVVNKEQS